LEALLRKLGMSELLQFRWLPARLLYLNKDGFAVLKTNKIRDAVAVGLDKLNDQPSRFFKACLDVGLDFALHYLKIIRQRDQ
jgi:hypothetical protein